MASKKYTALCVYEILKNYSNEHNPLTQRQIIDYLYKEYNIEIKRKSIGSIINEMMDDEVFSNKYDIEKDDSRGSVYLGSRIIEVEEMTYLIDALLSSKSLTTKQANEIIEKLSKEFSEYDRKSFKNVHKFEGRNRTDNKNVLFTVSTISEAIEKNVMIKFNYKKILISGKKNNKVYTVSPYFLINSDSRYYLVSKSDEHEDLTHFRVDLIENVEILDNKSIPITNIDKYRRGFDVVKYVNRRPHLFSGEEVNAKIKLLKDESLRYIIEWFGNVKPYQEKSEFYVNLHKINEMSLIIWCLQYCDFVELVEPISTRDKIKNKLSTTLSRYK